MQVDLLPKLPPSGAYRNIITAIDAFSKLAIAYSVSSPKAVNRAKDIIDTTRDSSLPAVEITDKGSVFIRNVIHEMADVLGITPHHPTTKHAQTIGAPERTYATKRYR